MAAILYFNGAFQHPFHQEKAPIPTRVSNRSFARVGTRKLTVVCNKDYEAAGSDSGVLRMERMTELILADLTNVFGYPRNMLDEYFLGKVIGRGSFGIVQECLESASGSRYAVKKIDKFPKRGKPTPRYLLKLRAEVETMQQLGYSLDTVNLK
eukprot:gene29609-17890_t